MIDLPPYDQDQHIKDEVAELLDFIDECHKAAAERPEFSERLRAVADEQARRLPSLGRYIKSMAHVYRDRRDPR